MIGNHPTIREIERYGYPLSQEEHIHRIYCEECGRDITHLNHYEDEHHRWLCCDCLLFFHRKE